ncbi:hypothetical protein X740_10420 [Mesorhizobium sp. LNHC221B00]|nr:hypothetical protein X740_10420 [Mesorhizobium sp. LNHC221B00]
MRPRGNATASHAKILVMQNIYAHQLSAQQEGTTAVVDAALDAALQE